MGIFTQEKVEIPVPRKRPEATGLSIIGPDLRVEGDLETEGVVKVEGQVRGAIGAGQQVLVAAGSTVEGDIQTREAVVGGAVRGSIVASERVELLPTAVVTGNVTTVRLLIHEGGRINGEIVMQSAAEREREPAQPQAQPKGPAQELPAGQRPALRVEGQAG
jgi:cytoskeletal protein CcmA (bactofilin family)